MGGLTKTQHVETVRLKLRLLNQTLKKNSFQITKPKQLGILNVSGYEKKNKRLEC
jgi:hypothetical protein